MKHLEKCQISKAIGEVVRFQPDGMLFWVIPFRNEKWYIGIRRFGKDFKEVVWDYIEPTTEVEVVKLASWYYDGHYGLKKY